MLLAAVQWSVRKDHQNLLSVEWPSLPKSVLLQGCQVAECNWVWITFLMCFSLPQICSKELSRSQHLSATSSSLLEASEWTQLRCRRCAASVCCTRPHSQRWHRSACRSSQVRAHQCFLNHFKWREKKKVFLIKLYWLIGSFIPDNSSLTAGWKACSILDHTSDQ